ncbi:hypothetical protein GGI25_004183 [Coemansia spiralis]|uniref:Uncharacterized protein n=2 Tax=Coemansia TaxID=4863 RepID=A0A9W8KVS5_9FUNG|nr:hypothetical protein EDC05_006228 [Coemansia umbellata]KAJ2625009.1 hypothetical protein GGI26_001121 [Coemansia sp. RSA 1358]KAJ2674796.1 hypothetical protein GGI25_004183 [Coemansia spiralis]
MRGTIYITLLLATVASGEIFFNIPAGLDRNTVQSAFTEHGIQGYDPMAHPNAQGLFTGKQAKQSSGPPAPGNPVTVPLAPHAHKEALVQSNMKSVMTSTVVVMSTTTMPVGAQSTVGLMREKPSGTASIMEEEEIEEEEIEEEVKETKPAQQAQPAQPAQLVQSVQSPQSVQYPQSAQSSQSVQSASNKQRASAQPTGPTRPIMLARASASAFKPDDIDKFTFPSTDVSVNMAGPGKDSPKSSSHMAFHASMPSAAPHSSAKPISAKPTNKARTASESSSGSHSSESSMQDSMAASVQMCVGALAAAALGYLF